MTTITIYLIITAFTVCPFIYFAFPESFGAKLMHTLLSVISVSLIIASIYPFDATILTIGIILLIIYTLQSIRMYRIKKKSTKNIHLEDINL